MRRFGWVLCLFAASTIHAGDDAKKTLESLQGEWRADKILVAGNDATETLKNQSFLFKGKEIFIRENDKDTDNKSKFEIDTVAKPPLIDVHTKEGDTLEGIFELKGDVLKICVSLQKGNRPTEFASPANSMIVLAEMKRIKK